MIHATFSRVLGVLTAGALLLAGCGGGGGGGPRDGGGVGSLAGVFQAAGPVAGVHYQTASRDGVTGADGGVTLELRLPASAVTGVRALLLPGGAPGPGLLSGADQLAHLRLRPSGGLDLAALVPDSGQAPAAEVLRVNAD